MSLGIKVSGRSDVGRIRSNNEDNLGYDGRYGIYVVCDGMGGQAAGEVASKLAVDTILGFFRNSANRAKPSQALLQASSHGGPLVRAIEAANEVLVESGARNPLRMGMGTTVVAALLSEDGCVTIGNVGDSRAYLVRGGQISQLTEDHSLVMEHVRRGLMTIEEAKHSEVQNIIVRALGAEESVEVDLREFVASAGDVVLLCSDGLTRDVDDATILDIIETSEGLDVARDALIDAAKNSGGHDNVTVLLLVFEEHGWYEKLLGRITGRGRNRRNSM